MVNQWFWANPVLWTGRCKSFATNSGPAFALATIIDLDEIVRGEFAENAIRKDFGFHLAKREGVIPKTTPSSARLRCRACGARWLVREATGAHPCRRKRAPFGRDVECQRPRRLLQDLWARDRSIPQLPYPTICLHFRSGFRARG